jgi:putative hemolysin
MAIVLDEFQRMAGVVTIEDALEEIVGEIVNESTAAVERRVMIDDLNEALDWQLPESDDYETVAGFVLYHTGLILDKGQCRQIGDVDFEILKASHRKIESIRIRRMNPLDKLVG